MLAKSCNVVALRGNVAALTNGVAERGPDVEDGKYVDRFRVSIAEMKLLENSVLEGLWCANEVEESTAAFEMNDRSTEELRVSSEDDVEAITTTLEVTVVSIRVAGVTIELLLWEWKAKLAVELPAVEEVGMKVFEPVAAV